MEINKSLVIPCKDEGPEFVIILKRFISYLKNDTEVIVVVDSKDDSTISEIEKSDLDVPILINTYGKGPAYAVRFGIDNSNGKAVCVAMGDGSDDPKQVEDLFFSVNHLIYKKYFPYFLKNIHNTLLDHPKLMSKFFYGLF